MIKLKALKLNSLDFIKNKGIAEMKDSTKRFSDRVENYIKYRPGYPADIIEFLKVKCGLSRDLSVADIGSGTGILTKLFLSNGNIVYGIEPNKQMREAGEKYLTQHQNFKSVNGTAENTTLNDNSVDIIAAGQSFHWFNINESIREFSRILRPDGWTVLIWNSRRTNTNKFSADYEQLLLDFGIDYKKVDHKNINEDTLKKFFKEYDFNIFPNFQDLDLEGFKGRLLSSSYIPERTHPVFNKMMNRTEEIFRNSEKDGKVRIEYNTELYYGKII